MGCESLWCITLKVALPLMSKAVPSVLVKAGYWIVHARAAKLPITRQVF